MKLRLLVAILSSTALVAVGACDKGKQKPEGKQVQPAQPPAPAAGQAGPVQPAPEGGEAAKVGHGGGAAAEAPARPTRGAAARKAPTPTRPTGKQPTAADKAAAAKMEHPSKGASNPVVSIVEFSEFQCPYCKRVGPTVEKLLKEYDGKVRFTFMHNPLPFHNNALPASKAAVAAQKQGKFWEMHDKLFANQRALSQADLEKYAQELGLDMAQFKKDMNAPVTEAYIKHVQSIAHALRATGTPAFFINGKPLKGAQPFERFKAVVDEEIAAAGGKSGDDWVKSRTKANNAALASYVYEGKQPPAVAERPQRRRSRPVAKTVYKVEFDADKDAVKGDLSKALVTLVLFSEFQCPFCNRVKPSIDKVVETYGDKVAVVFKHNPLPFHKDAFPASQAAMCAKEQGKFWEMHDKLFANQRALKPDNLKSYAQELGLDMGKWQKCFDSGKYKAQIEADQELAGKVTARGTPNTFVNGRKLTGAKPFEEFKELIDEEMKKAEAMVAKGTPVEKVYAEIIKDGKVFEPLDAQVNDFKFTADSATWGDPKKAKIVITEFSDFQCPFCSRVGKPLKDVQKHYGDQMAIVFKNFPLSFHKGAMPAAQAALCAKDQGKWAEMHDHLFANQKELGAATTDTLVEWAKTVGVKDMGKFKKCLESGEKKAQIEAEMAEGRKAGVRGTPTLYINGRKFTSPSGYNLPAFTSVIDKYILKK